ncbi:HK97 family phage prohead protease [Streptomyces sp. NPDC055085]
MQKHLCVRDVDFALATPDAEESRDNGEPSSGVSADGRTLDGYAAVFSTPTNINSWEGRFEETIAPGAFTKTLRERTPMMQWNHGHDTRVGAVPIGVYTTLSEEAAGLHVTGRLFDNPVVEPIRQAIEAQAVNGMSINFVVVRDNWTDNTGKEVRGQELYSLLYDAKDRGPLKREIREAKLFEAGPVANPAYATTSVGVRSEDLSMADREAFIQECLRTSSDVDAIEFPEPEVVVPEVETVSEAREEVTPDDAALAGTSDGHVETPSGFSPEVRARRLKLLAL